MRKSKTLILKDKFLIIVLLFFVSQLYAKQDGSANETGNFISGGIAWSQDGSMLAIGSNNGLHIYDTPTFIEIMNESNQTNITSVDWSPDNTMIASGSFDGAVQIWDASTYEVLSIVEEHNQPVTTVSWNPQGTLLASGSWDNWVIIQDVSTSEILRRFWGTVEQNELRSVQSVSWSPDGNRIALNGTSRIAIWDVENDNKLFDWVNLSSISSVAWSPEGNVLAIGGSLDTVSESTVEFRDTSNGSLLSTFELDENNSSVESLRSIEAIAWSSTGDKLAIASTNRSFDVLITVLDVEEQSILAELPAGFITGDVFYSNALAWSPTGNQLASVSDDGRVFVWDARTYETLVVYAGYESIVLSDQTS